MTLSIVATLYRSADHLAEFHRRASAAASRQAQDDFEVVLVNDGSPDDSLARAIALSDADPRVVVVDLSRNFGHQKAMMAGLAHAIGDRVFLIDSDLEEDPAWLDAFAAEMADAACDVVFGVQAERKGGWFERWSGAVYYRLMAAISDVPMPASMVTARLMTRRYVDALLLHEERETEIGGLWSVTGFEQRALPVVKTSGSETTYTIRRRVALLVNAVTSFSVAPLTAIVALGLVLLVVTVVVALVLLARIAYGDDPDAAAWVALSVWLVGALILTAIGVVGVYLAKILAEVKRRPNTIVRQVHGRDR